MKYDFIIGMCLYNGLKDVTFLSMERLHWRTDYKFRVYCENRGAPIGRERSVVCTRFLNKNESEYIIFIDGDILFQISDITNILNALKQGYPVVAGAYLVQNAQHFAVRTWENVHDDGLLHEAEYVSTGFMGIRRDALIQIRDKLDLPVLHRGVEKECWPFFESRRDMKNKFYLSEDWDFCLKAREAGLKVYFHAGVILPHMKEALIGAQSAYKEYTINEEMV